MDNSNYLFVASYYPEILQDLDELFYKARIIENVDGVLYFGQQKASFFCVNEGKIVQMSIKEIEVILKDRNFKWLVDDFEE